MQPLSRLQHRWLLTNFYQRKGDICNPCKYLHLNLSHKQYTSQTLRILWPCPSECLSLWLIDDWVIDLCIGSACSPRNQRQAGRPSLRAEMDIAAGRQGDLRPTEGVEVPLHELSWGRPSPSPHTSPRPHSLPPSVHGPWFDSLASGKEALRFVTERPSR